ncbi:hypothetical protein [Nocardioides convexus]|uniref:hypothetical protein n=1 Tax=Nocardioides convexus TaxID=2712224 RepID=UPI0024184819|nr:hypothetical protein [Nocardioides convexus]
MVDSAVEPAARGRHRRGDPRRRAAPCGRAARLGLPPLSRRPGPGCCSRPASRAPTSSAG